ncbi:hypothetical protein HanHA300_Chr00c0352g0749361 [Helianthus annuus]|nr:hypothetical protein HanHA300_Chr00c0352g0749361 [Helianthus annuus]
MMLFFCYGYSALLQTYLKNAFVGLVYFHHARHVIILYHGPLCWCNRIPESHMTIGSCRKDVRHLHITQKSKGPLLDHSTYE